MEHVVISIIVTLVSGAIGALIGTYGGAYFSANRQERRIKELRNMAVKALQIFLNLPEGTGE